MIIFGLGTGRCGTLSLSYLLNNQHNSYVTHEKKPIVSWYSTENNIKILDSRIKSYNNNSINYGDVSSSYLNYVEYIYAHLKDRVRFICLERNIDELIISWLKKTPRINHWSKFGPHNGWSKIFPKYNIVDKKQCLERYIKEYQEKSKILENSISTFKIFNTKDLNDENKIEKILRFCNIENPHIFKVHKNATK